MDFKQYELMRDVGVEPTATCITAHQNGLDIEACTEMLVAVYQLSEAEAKEISVVASDTIRPLNGALD
ncbi:MAG: hypothetical protein JXB30_10345 [Anaerolineae bacterium]|nr:hypothetical protein [Anaerolineae bacterium]